MDKEKTEIPIKEDRYYKIKQATNKKQVAKILVNFWLLFIERCLEC